MPLDRKDPHPELASEPVAYSAAERLLLCEHLKRALEEMMAMPRFIRYVARVDGWQSARRRCGSTVISTCVILIERSTRARVPR